MLQRADGTFCRVLAGQPISIRQVFCLSSEILLVLQQGANRRVVALGASKYSIGDAIRARGARHVKRKMPHTFRPYFIPLPLLSLPRRIYLYSPLRNCKSAGHVARRNDW